MSSLHTGQECRSSLTVRGTLVSFFGMLLIVEVASDLLHLRSDGSGISSYNVGHQSLLWYTE